MLASINVPTDIQNVSQHHSLLVLPTVSNLVARLLEGMCYLYSSPTHSNFSDMQYEILVISNYRSTKSWKTNFPASIGTCLTGIILHVHLLSLFEFSIKIASIQHWSNWRKAIHSSKISWALLSSNLASSSPILIIGTALTYYKWSWSTILCYVLAAASNKKMPPTLLFVSRLHSLLLLSKVIATFVPMASCQRILHLP